jgi:hypothetical protein
VLPALGSLLYPNRRDAMALARVVAFSGVTRERMDEMKSEIESGERRPDDIPATEFLLLHDSASDESLAILFFDNEEDYATGHATLDAMPRDDTPGTRTSVRKYDVIGRMTN